MKNCTIDGCSRRHDARGYCSTHYRRWREHGDPHFGGLVISPGGPPDFLKKAILHKGNDCLPWPYARTNEGYGHLTLFGQSLQAHVAVLSSWRRKPYPRAVAAHLCGNGHLGCINPQHLAWLSQKENLAQRLLHGTYWRFTKAASAFIKRHGHRHPALELAEAFSLPVDFLIVWGTENGVTFHDKAERVAA